MGGRDIVFKLLVVWSVLGAALHSAARSERLHSGNVDGAPKGDPEQMVEKM